MPTPTKPTRRGPQNTYPANHDWERVGATLREIRTIRDLTQDELAVAIGYRRGSSISQIESGLRPLTNAKLKAAAKVLGVHPTDIRRVKLTAVKEKP
ncbi:helix-turn-helix domain-containing protein [Paenarthrobacter nicotinovorans]|uniref:helix-turn-helix domain-containing protein n=1 Tax=Paenarthrobacter nicotinovorans TaxID=29320 RepID=UPI003816E200